MIWTLIVFAITFFVLRRYAFGPIQTAIDKRRDRIREALDAADRRVPSRRSSSAEQREALPAARVDRPRRCSRRPGSVADAPAAAAARGARRRATATHRGDAQGRSTPRPQRAIGQIRTEVARLALEATEKVTGKVLTDADQRRLIEEAIDELDFSALEKETV